MFKNYFKTAFNSLLRNKLHTFINVVGLCVAITSSIIIFLYARHELSFDVFHENAELIQLVYKERATATGTEELDDTWVPLLEVMQERIPQIVGGTRVYEESNLWVESAGEKFRQEVVYADPSMLSMFTFPLQSGNQNSALNDISSAVISQEVAQRFFGDANPIGQLITIGFNKDYLVSGVLEEIPIGSTYRPDIILPFASLLASDETLFANAGWNRSFLDTFLLLEEGASAAELEPAFESLVSDLFGEEGANGANRMKLKLWSLLSLHDKRENSAFMSWALIGIALAIIVIACINFMNLSVTRSLERSKEVGLRKTLGSQRAQLIPLFFIEPVLITAIAMFISLQLTTFLLPMFNQLYGVELALHLNDDSLLVMLLLIVGFCVPLLSGLYPAVLISAFSTIDSMKGNLKTGPAGIKVRNSLTIFQYSMAIMLISSIAITWQQVSFMQNQALNFNPESVVVIPIQTDDFAEGNAAVSRIESFKDELTNMPGVLSVSSSMSVPSDYPEANFFADPEGWTGEEPVRMLLSITDKNYFDTYQMEFIEGESFAANPAIGAGSVIINETAMRAIGWETAVGKQLNSWTVTGVVKDFHYRSLKESIRPITHLYMTPEEGGYDAFGFISVKLDPSLEQSALLAINSLWSQLEPSRPLSYFFSDDAFSALDRNIVNLGEILGYFALVSVLIANLGLLGLTSYSVVQRTREIGVRKAIGGTVFQITGLLSAQFMKPVLLANLIAWPLAWYFMNLWLESFAYRIDLTPLVFIGSGLIALCIAWVTVGSTAAKAASQKPVLALKYE